MKERELSYGEDDEFEIYLTPKGVKFQEYLEMRKGENFDISDFEEWYKNFDENVN